MGGMWNAPRKGVDTLIGYVEGFNGVSSFIKDSKTSIWPSRCGSPMRRRGARCHTASAYDREGAPWLGNTGEARACTTGPGPALCNNGKEREASFLPHAAAKTHSLHLRSG